MLTQLPLLFFPMEKALATPYYGGGGYGVGHGGGYGGGYGGTYPGYGYPGYGGSYGGGGSFTPSYGYSGYGPYPNTGIIIFLHFKDEYQDLTIKLSAKNQQVTELDMESVTDTREPVVTVMASFAPTSNMNSQ